MRRNGQAGAAVGAAMTACFLGAAFGAMVLALLIPVMREAALLFGPPEIFILCAMGLTFVAVIGRDDVVRALIAGLAGVVFALVGVYNVTNNERLTFGIPALADGISLVPLVLGLFAVAEIITLWMQGGTLAGTGKGPSSFRQTQSQVFRGIGITVRKWWLVLRCSTLGTVIGIIPGLGSATAAFIAYGHAKQTASDPESFGSGNIEGVIAPEAANDAVEGGALASTIAFGVPGSSSMAILLSGLTILGLETGPQMFTGRAELVFVMVATIILGNLIGTVGGIALAAPLVRVTSLRASIVVPVLLAVVVSGAFAGDRLFSDLVVPSRLIG